MSLSRPSSAVRVRVRACSWQPVYLAFAHAHSIDADQATAGSERDTIQVRAKIKATQESILKSIDNDETIKLEDARVAKAFFIAQHKQHFKPTTKQVQSSWCNGNSREHEMYSAAMQRFDMHEEMYNDAWKYCGNATAAQEKFRLEQRLQQISIMEYLGFPFNPNDERINQLSAAYVWLRTMLYDCTHSLPWLK